MIARTGLAAALALALLPPVGRAPAGAAAATTGQPPPLEVVGVTQLDPRLLDVTFSDPLTGPALGYPHARILLPSGYGTSPGLHPVLYLLHGAGDTAASWTSNSDGQTETLEQFTADKDVVVVMPDGGANANAGWYSDWFNGGAFGSPAWESFHLDQLIPWVESNFAVRADRAGRAIGGLSMGGFGAMSYAARHPGMFAAVLSFSGAVDTAAIPYVEPTGLAAVHSRFGTPTAAVWGTWGADELRWRGHNPADLAAWSPGSGATLSNLRSTRLWFTSGMGLPGGPAPDDDNPGSLFVESAVFGMNVLLDVALTQAGVAHTFVPYARGAHDWWHWQQDIRDAWPVLAATFASPSSDPASVDAESMEPVFDAWGWDITVTRPAAEFMDLLGAGESGFTLRGSGAADVLTAPRFTPGALYSVTASGVTASVAPASVIADAAGRLHLHVVLGPGHSLQEFTLAADLRALAPAYWETAVVHIARDQVR